MIRLAFGIDNFQIGGTELNAVRWAEQLSRERFQLSVVHLQADGPLRARFQQAGAKLLQLRLRSLYGPRALREGLRLATFLARERIDVFHTHDVYSNIFGVPWARLARVPAVVASRRWWNPSPSTGRAHEIANRWAYRAAHGVLANSPSVAALLIQRDGVPPAKISVIPNSLAESAFIPLPPADRAAWRARLGVPGDALVVGIVARMDRDKDHATLLDAFARVAARIPRAHLLCIGDGPERPDLSVRAADFGLNGRARFPGTITAPFNLHHLFDVSVLCSITEASPNAVLEGMAAARPVIATRVGGVPDLVRDGETGVLVPPGDPPALVAALCAVLEAPERARVLGQAAQTYVRAEHAERRIIERLSTWYESLVPPTRAGA
ncbi:MAG TPA: glycosyltransferase [Gemmatimonadales bacterium]|nr:glycosyltransferase [Gemmatimonadales bacterium]